MEVWKERKTRERERERKREREREEEERIKEWWNGGEMEVKKKKGMEESDNGMEKGKVRKQNV